MWVLQSLYNRNLKNFQTPGWYSISVLYYLNTHVPTFLSFPITSNGSSSFLFLNVVKAHKFIELLIRVQQPFLLIYGLLNFSRIKIETSFYTSFYFFLFLVVGES
jgi:hypothetical protein